MGWAYDARVYFALAVAPFLALRIVVALVSPEWGAVVDRMLLIGGR